jgi:hypothetical protein
MHSEILSLQVEETAGIVWSTISLSHVYSPICIFCTTQIHAELMGYFARNLWRRLWDAISQELSETCDLSEDCNPEGRLAALDTTGTGTVTVEEIQMALRDYLGFSVDDRELSLAEFVHSFADTTGDGKVALRDVELFCQEMKEDYENDEKWKPSYTNPTVRTETQATIRIQTTARTETETTMSP